jgi:hypothetical protein
MLTYEYSYADICCDSAVSLCAQTSCFTAVSAFNLRLKASTHFCSIPSSRNRCLDESTPRWCMLTYVEVCCMLTYADVCWRILTYADGLCLGGLETHYLCMSPLNWLSPVLLVALLVDDA